MSDVAQVCTKTKEREGEKKRDVREQRETEK